MASGLTDVDVKDPEVKKALDYAVAEHNASIDSIFLNKVAEVIKAQRQEDSGIKYIFVVKMGCTALKRGEEDRLNEVAVHQDPEKAMLFQRTFTVVCHPGTKEMSMTEEI